MNVSQALDDIKAYLESDPLIQAAANLVIPVSTRQVLADAVSALAADLASVSQAAAEQARAESTLNQAAAAEGDYVP